MAGFQLKEQTFIYLFIHIIGSVFPFVEIRDKIDAHAWSHDLINEIESIKLRLFSQIDRTQLQKRSKGRNHCKWRQGWWRVNWDDVRNIAFHNGWSEVRQSFHRISIDRFHWDSNKPRWTDEFRSWKWNRIYRLSTEGHWSSNSSCSFPWHLVHEDRRSPNDDSRFDGYRWTMYRDLHWRDLNHHSDPSDEERWLFVFICWAEESPTVELLQRSVQPRWTIESVDQQIREIDRQRMQF